MNKESSTIDNELKNLKHTEKSWGGKKKYEELHYYAYSDYGGNHDYEDYGHYEYTSLSLSIYDTVYI